MATDTGGEVFDLSAAFDDVLSLEEGMQTLANVTVPQSADAMALAFEDAGQRIEAALMRAARTGEINFEGMITSILADLARIGVGAALDQVIGAVGQSMGGGAPVSINIAVPEGATADSVFAAQGQIASVLGQAVQSGARWS